MVQTFPGWLVQARGSCSQNDLALAARAVDPASRISQSRISEWERGIARPSLRQLTVVCAALRLQPEAAAVARALWDAAELSGLSLPPTV